MYHSRHTAPRTVPRLLAGLMAFFALAAAFAPPEPALAQLPEFRPRHIGYGISVGPHLESRPDMLDQLGFDWVKLYDVAQIDDYPNHRILYRVDVRGYPDNIEDWERGLVDLAGQLSALGVDAVEVGNEANLIGEWGGQMPNARLFTDALCRAYRAFKRTAPQIIIVAGGLAPATARPDGSVLGDLDFARDMFRNGAARCFDAWAYHPYGFNQPPEASPSVQPFSFRRAELMNQLVQANAGYKQMWITEFGWVRDPGEEGLQCANDPMFNQFEWMKFSAQTQAAYTVRAFEYAERNWPWAGPMFLWNLNWNQYQPDYEVPCSHLRWYGILRSDGSPLPVYNALVTMPKRAPIEYLPRVSGVSNGLSTSVEAGCAGRTRLGSFTAANRGYPAPMRAQVLPVNGPGQPETWTSHETAAAGTEVQVFVDAAGLRPGTYVVIINLLVEGQRTVSADTVRGYLQVTPAERPQCVARSLFD